MDDLERYLKETYRSDMREVEELQELIAEVFPVFLSSWDTKKKEWPYGLPAEENGKGEAPAKTEGKLPAEENEKEKPKYSFSTNAMILFMLALVREKIKGSSLLPSLPDNPGFQRLIKLSGGQEAASDPDHILDHGLDELLKKVLENVDDKTHKSEDKFLTKSSTYGHNDVFTLTWLVELIRLVKLNGVSLVSVTQTQVSEIAKSLEEAIEKLKTETRRGKLRCVLYHNKDDERRQREEVLPHAFPLLRMVQLLEAAKLLKEPDKSIKFDVEDLGGEEVFEFFERGLHQHLAYKSIPESRFDPAELVFCLEGALRFPASNISDEAINRALEVIGESQDDSPYWRPIKPTLAMPQGNILLPISVEVANSLLRVCGILDGRHREYHNFRRCIPLFRRYVRWLKAQKTNAKNGKENHSGWQSEHVGRDQKIHLWQTSEILVFLMNYQLMLQKDVARKMKDSSGVLTKPKTIDARPRNVAPVRYWREGATKKEGDSKESDKHIIFGQDDIGGGWKKGEPLQWVAADSRYLIYELIEKRYIEPRYPEEVEKGGNPYYSFLLYGPPGTGKTTLCEELAKSLSWELIIVTPSDFLAGGAAEVEARAKAIFTMLERQKDKVILFDEIDHFLLDRDSDAYKGQQGIFQFMTPGMLPKLSNLRSAESSIFVIATNYAERIDSAVKRRGRIDHHFILLPPGLDQRLRILRQRIQEEAKNLFKEELLEKLANGAKTNKERRDLDKTLQGLARATPLYSWTELKQLVEDITEHGAVTSLLEFSKNAEKAMEGIRPTIRLTAYVDRLKVERPNNAKDGGDRDKDGGDRDIESEPDWSKTPAEETLLLAYLRLEAIYKKFEHIGEWDCKEPAKQEEVKGSNFNKFVDLSAKEEKALENVLQTLRLNAANLKEKLEEIIGDKTVVSSLSNCLPQWF